MSRRRRDVHFGSGFSESRKTEDVADERGRFHDVLPRGSGGLGLLL